MEKPDLSFFTSLPGEVRSIVMSMSVCLYVCLSTCMSRKPQGRSLPKLCACCLRPWLGPPLMELRLVTYMYFRFSEFHTIGPISQNQAGPYISMKFARWRHKLKVRPLSLVFGRVDQNAASGTKSAIYICRQPFGTRGETSGKLHHADPGCDYRAL